MKIKRLQRFRVGALARFKARDMSIGLGDAIGRRISTNLTLVQSDGEVVRIWTVQPVDDPDPVFDGAVEELLASRDDAIDAADDGGLEQQ